MGETGLQVLTVMQENLGSNINTISMAENGEFVLCGTDAGKVFFFDRDGSKIWQKDFNSPVLHSSTTSHCEYSLIATGDKKLYFLNIQGNVLWSSTLEYPATSIIISKDSKYIVVAIEDGTVLFYDRNGLLMWKALLNSPVCIASSVSANYVVAGAGNKKFYYFDNYTTHMSGKVLWTGETVKPVHSIACSQDGFLVVVCDCSELSMYNKYGQKLWTTVIHPNHSTMSISGKGDLVLSGFSPGSQPSSIVLYSRAGQIEWRHFFGTDVVTCAEICSTGRFIFAGTKGGKISLFHKDTKLLWEKDYKTEIRALAVSAVGSFVALGTAAGDFSILNNSQFLKAFRTNPEAMGEKVDKTDESLIDRIIYRIKEENPSAVLQSHKERNELEKSRPDWNK